MGRVERLEQQIAELDGAEFRVLLAWFERFDAEGWDRQIESDAKSGSLSRLAGKAIQDHEAGLKGIVKHHAATSPMPRCECPYRAINV